MTSRGKSRWPATDTIVSLQDFGGRLRAALRERRISKLYAVASDLGVSQSAVSRWQNGGRISLDNVVLICEYLDVSADWLLLNRGSAHAHRDFRPTRAEIELLALLRQRLTVRPCAAASERSGC